ncbi:protein NO VEIN domain-containing protein [Clostridium tertium]|uniref:protein NO VEIN domain-containing protein n=1 Tax=Clostridium tertium TaxID=1559 RepID=UPI0023B32CE8|nr:DUF3883 domain-containing protein [Clostridium tertium]
MDETKTWLDIRKEKGDKGESIVELYLENKFPDTEIEHIPIEEAYKGYDFKINDNYYEAKVLGDCNTIHMTINELQKAILYEDSYILSVVNIDKGSLHLIHNPVKTLELPPEYLISCKFTNNYCNIFIGTFKIYLKRLDAISIKIDVKEYINKIE